MSELTIHRLDEDDVIEMARGIVMGDRYLYDVEGVKCGAPMFLVFSEWAEGEAEQIALVVGDLTKRSTRNINGYPCTMSGWAIHNDDKEAVLAKLDSYYTALGLRDPKHAKREITDE